MSELVSREIQDGFAAIVKAHNRNSAAEAYRDFQLMLDEATPGPKTLEAAADQIPEILGAIARVRDGRVHHSSDGELAHHIFRGSGTIATGNSEGKITAISIKARGEKLTAEEHPYIAVRQLGLGALAAQVSEGDMPSRQTFQIVQNLLYGLNLTATNDPPHRLGYTFMSAGEGDGVIVAAHDMLVQRRTLDAVSSVNRGLIEQGIERHWIRSSDDMLAGFFNQVAAQSVAMALADPAYFEGREYSDSIVQMSPRVFGSDINVH